MPRVTDMRNGMWRPEVVWARGRHSDIVLGELYDDRLRAQITAAKAASFVTANAACADRIRQETERSLRNCNDLVQRIWNQIM